MKDLKGQSPDQKQGKYWDHLRTYRVMALILSPLFLVYLLLESQLEVEVNIFQKSLLIYTAVMLLIFLILAKFEIFRENFLIAHYGFLAGAMIINLAWYYNSPGVLETASILLASNLIGIGIVQPKVTIGFYVLTIIAFVWIGVANSQIDIEVSLMLLVTALVISSVNYWRFKLNKNLINSRETFKGIFDSSNQQIYVLSERFEILDLSHAAEKYLKSKGELNARGKIFQDVFTPEEGDCVDAFMQAFKDVHENGSAKFNANCAVVGTSTFVPKEFNIREGKYFDKEVVLLTMRIIQEEKEYERELLEHKDNVTQILENIDYFVFNITFDVNDRFKHHVNFVSSKVNDVYGYSVDEYIAAIKSERIDKDRHPDDRDRINNMFEELLKVGGNSSWRFRMKVDNKYRWMEEKIFIEKSEDGNEASLFGMVKDVTEEIEAQEALVASEKRYRQIFETNLAGVYKTHLDGTIIDCNLAFANIFGYDTVEELMNQKVREIYFSEEDRLKYLAELKEQKQLNNYPLTLKRKDGRRLIVHNNVSLVADEEENETIIIGTLVDLTDQHETSLALQHSEEKYRLLFSESNNAILLVVLNEDESFVVDANQMALKLFQKSEEQLVGQQLSDLLSDKLDVVAELNEIRRSLENQERTERELDFVREDGLTFHAEVSLASVLVDDENVVQLVIKDISERKQYEKEILESRLSFKNIVDRSPASILIFSKNELAYVNPKGEDLFLNVLNSENRNLYKVFPEERHQLINDLINEARNDINSYTEIELGEGENAKRYSINVVNTTYNFEKALLFLLQDITLQTEYNIQKLRAEMAEETNISLQEEIKRHKLTQLSLVESTSKLKALFESAAHLYIISIDQNFDLVSFNQNFKELVKDYLGKEIAVGMNFLEIFPIEEYAYDIIIERLRKVLAGEPSNLVSTFDSLKGEVWMESFMSPILIEGQETQEISFISHDITEQIENRKKILATEENNRAILVAIPDILFKANREGVFTDFRASSEANKQAFERFIKTSEIAGKKIEDVWKDTEIAKKVKESVKTALLTDKLVTHNFSMDFGEKGEEEKVHFENRYSKVNEDEVVIISRNVTSTIEYEEKLIESVKEKEVLLKEVHHRVKNNLQVINSILNLQSSYVQDEETLQIIIESQNRIRSMSYIHESLYQTKDFSSINFQDYITNLVQNLVHSYEVYSDKTDLDLKVEGVNLALDQAIPCGLILNELITNALKYAYPIEEGGKITIEVYEKGGKVYMHVQDFGKGLPKDFDIAETDSLGLSLVDTLIDQLDGELNLKTDSGTEFLIIFDKQEI